jgi:hypothetical protein
MEPRPAADKRSRIELHPCGIQKAVAKPLHCRVEIAVRNGDRVEGHDGRDVCRKLRGLRHATALRQQGDYVAFAVEGMGDLPTHPIALVRDAIGGMGLQKDDKVCTFLDLMQDRVLKYTAVDAVDVHEHVEAVGAEVFAHEKSGRRRNVATV